MRVLNILVIENSVPRIIDSFPIVEEQFSHEVIKVAEDKLCSCVFGPKYHQDAHEDDVFMVISNAYVAGVKVPTGNIYYLVWSHMSI